MNRTDALIDSDVVIAILPKGGFRPGEIGLKDIEAGIAMRKSIYVWRVPGRINDPLPDCLDGYEDHHVFDGDAQGFGDFMANEMGLPLPLFDTAYDAGYER